jgi:aldehyde dehydrogenase (NAD+)
MTLSLENLQRFYINGNWIEAVDGDDIDVINPATEASIGTLRGGTAADVDRAVAAARDAFEIFAGTSVESRLELLQRIQTEYASRRDDLAQAISMEMGAPIDLARTSQVALGAGHLESAMRALENFPFEEQDSGMILRHEPIGVCGMITPWNWPMNQVVVKVAPALAAGCTMLLKPSEESPLSAMVFAEIMDAAGVPAGVFNMIQGYGPVVGEAMSAHPGIDMMSFTGSTRGGIAVARAAAETVKRVGQELGGKSANIILDDCDIPSVVARGVRYCMGNSGQSCNAPTRMLVPMEQMDTAIRAAREAAENMGVGDPSEEGDHIGPVVNQRQFERIQSLIQAGIDEGAELVAGGVGRPEGLDRGYYVRPTVFARVDNDMSIAREEIFGPVICIIGYRDEDDAVRLANDTVYGLAGYVSSADVTRATRVARRMRAGQIAVNYRAGTSETPFGGFKQSGNGREKARWGLMEYLELKAITGAVA